jgi:RHS repeat-associated protein
VCASRHIDITPDEFGNSVQQIEYGGATAGDVLRTTRRGFRLASGPYIVSLPWYESVFEGTDLSKPAAANTLYCYDSDNDSCSSVPAKGLLTATKSWNEQALQYHSTTYMYDRYGNRTNVTDPNGHTTRIAHDPLFHLYPKSICDALNHCVLQQWDPVIAERSLTIDPNNQRTSFDYDPLGRLITTVFPASGGTHHRAYLDWGDSNRQRVREWDEDGSTDGLWTDHYLDGIGRVWRAVNKGDKAGTAFEQDLAYGDSSPQVYKQSHSYESGQTAPVYEVFAYDAAGRVVQQTHPDQTALRWNYNNDGDKTWVTAIDEASHEHTLYSDVNGRLRQVREHIDNRDLDTTYEYDALDNLVKVTDAAGNVTSSTWDSLGRKLSTTDPDMGHWTYTYDDSGNRLSQTDARRVETRFTYDALDRLKTRQPSWPHGKKTVWRYDETGHGAGIGRLTSITDPVGASCAKKVSERLAYDGMGQVVSMQACIHGHSYRLAFGYDTVGRQQSVTYPRGDKANYLYDAAGRLARIPGYVNSFSYNAAGQLVGAQLANGTQERSTYDPRREWLIGSTVSRGPTLLFQANYQFSPDGLLTSSSSATHKMNFSFAYDDLHRLSSVAGDLSQNFKYDALGNMIANSRVGSYTYPRSGPNGCGAGLACPHPHAVQTAGAEKYTYDANGNMIKRNGQQLRWNAENQLQLITTAKNRAVRYSYDAWGDRVLQERLRNGKVTERTFFFAPYVDDSTSAGLNKYFYAGDRLVARKNSTGTFTYHSDRLGSTRLVTDRTGRPRQRYDYQPFGERVGQPTSTFSNDIRFAGQRIDDLTGLVYMNARFYDPRLARFASADSLVPDPFEPQALNRYAYAYNNPTSYTDPSGHQPEDVEHPPLEVIDPPQRAPKMRFDALTVEGRLPPNLDPTIGAACSKCTFGIATLDSPFYTGPTTAPELPIGSIPPIEHGPMLYAADSSYIPPQPEPMPQIMDPNRGVLPDYQLQMLYGAIREPLVAAMGGSALRLAGMTPRLGLTIMPGLRIGGGAYALSQGNYGDARQLFASAALDLILASEFGAGTPLDELPVYSGGKTQGILATGAEEIELISGQAGPSATMPRGTPGMNGRIKTHVEAHAAAIMRNQGLNRATLYINRIPCSGVTGCNAMLSRMLPQGAQLTVVGPSGFSRVYRGR